MRIPVKDIIQSDCTDAEKPCYDHRCKHETDPVGAVMLKGKQGYQYDTCNWNLNICKKKKKNLTFFRMQFFEHFWNSKAKCYNSRQHTQ